MEEKVGEIWHRLITRLAQTRHPQAAVCLEQVSPGVGILFRVLGGDGGLQVEAAQATEYGGRRNLLQRIAGEGRQVRLAWRDDHALRLPAMIDWLPTRELNRDLYFWLAALAVGDRGEEEPWLLKNQRLTREILAAWPGLLPRYQRLVEAHLEQRSPPNPRRVDESAQEEAIRMALGNPGSVDTLPPSRRPPQPVPLWLHPFPPFATAGPTPDDGAGSEESGGRSRELEQARRRSERADKPQAGARGLVTIRMENIFTWSGFLNLDRGTEDNEDLESAADAARDTELISLSRNPRASAGKLRFDLDLPAASEDDQVLDEGTLLPEWDYRRQRLAPDRCRLVNMLAAKATPCSLPLSLGPTARRLRAQFEQLTPARVWRRGQPEGSEIDLDAYLRFATDRLARRVVAADGLYRDLRVGARDLACLLLADLSLSTDTWIGSRARVIDVIRDSLFLFAECLAATGDPFAMYGFSSRKQDPIRFHQLKRFEEVYSAAVRGRINAIKPGYYTRMGAAIRQGSRLLQGQQAGRRLLLILSDGKPNDLDRYEGRYGIEDTRQAVREARALGQQPFCVTVDSRASDYLPYLFGSGGYLVIRKPSQLPKELPLLYARLTADAFVA